MKKREERRGPTLFDFVESKQEQRTGKDVSEELYTFIKSRGRATKDEVIKWAKTRGIATSDLLRAVEKLVTDKKIRKRLDEDGSLVYEGVG